MTKLRPIHPGEILQCEFLEPLGVTANKLALALRVSAPTVYEIVHGDRAISTDMALRLARAFNTTPQFWLNLQTRYELELARDKEQARINREVQPIRAMKASART